MNWILQCNTIHLYCSLENSMIQVISFKLNCILHNKMSDILNGLFTVNRIRDNKNLNVSVELLWIRQTHAEETTANFFSTRFMCTCFCAYVRRRMYMYINNKHKHTREHTCTHKHTMLCDYLNIQAHKLFIIKLTFCSCLVFISIWISDRFLQIYFIHAWFT